MFIWPAWLRIRILNSGSRSADPLESGSNPDLNYCLLASYLSNLTSMGVVPELIRIQLGHWIHIQTNKNDIQKLNKLNKYHVLKSWTFSPEGWRLELLFRGMWRNICKFYLKFFTFFYTDRQDCNPPGYISSEDKTAGSQPHTVPARHRTQISHLGAIFVAFIAFVTLGVLHFLMCKSVTNTGVVPVLSCAFCKRVQNSSSNFSPIWRKQCVKFRAYELQKLWRLYKLLKFR